MADAVFFDFGGTLDADGRRWGERLYQGYHGLGGRLTLDAFEAHCHASDRMLEEQSGISRWGFREMVAVQLLLLQRMIPDAGALDLAAWRDDFVSEAQAVAKRNQPLLDRLGRRFELGIISNFTGNLRPCLSELGLENRFEVVFDSAVVGIRKPDRRFFDIAFGALGRQPEECWMVGDNPFNDIAPAAALGCSTCWLAPPGRPLPGDLTPTHRIATLPELVTLLL